MHDDQGRHVRDAAHVLEERAAQRTGVPDVNFDNAAALAEKCGQTSSKRRMNNAGKIARRSLNRQRLSTGGRAQSNDCVRFAMEWVTHLEPNHGNSAFPFAVLIVFVAVCGNVPPRSGTTRRTYQRCDRRAATHYTHHQRLTAYNDAAARAVQVCCCRIVAVEPKFSASAVG